MVINQMVSFWSWMILNIERKTISLYGDHDFPDLFFYQSMDTSDSLMAETASIPGGQ